MVLGQAERAKILWGITLGRIERFFGLRRWTSERKTQPDKTPKKPRTVKKPENPPHHSPTMDSPSPRPEIVEFALGVKRVVFLSHTVEVSIQHSTNTLAFLLSKLATHSGRILHQAFFSFSVKIR